jgi:hypothetical protein
MSKQRRPQSSIEQAGKAPAQDAERAAVPDQDALGNEALLSQLGAGRVQETPSADAAREAALAVVDRAQLALQVDGPQAERLARLEAIVAGSNLPLDRRQALLERLDKVGVESAAVHDAVMELQGADGPAVRAALAATLDGVRQAVANAQPTSDAGRASGAAAVDLVGQVAGQGVRTLCSALYLAVALDEEEEEELDGVLPEVDG